MRFDFKMLALVATKSESVPLYLRLYQPDPGRISNSELGLEYAKHARTIPTPSHPPAAPAPPSPH